MKKDAEKRLRHFDSWNTKLTLNIEYFKLTMKKKELVFFCHFFLFITWCQCMYKPVKIYQPRKFVKWLQFAILPELVFVRFALVRRCFGTSYLAGQGNVYSHRKLFCFYSINFLLICLFLSRQDVVNTQSEERYISGNRLTRKWNIKGWLIIRTTEVFILCILFIMRSHYSFVAKYRDDITLTYHDNSWSDTYPIFVNIYFRDTSKTQEL